MIKKKKISTETQANNILLEQSDNLLMDNNEFLNNKILTSNDITLTSEVNKSNEQSSNNQIVNLDINAKFLDIVKTLNPISKNDIKIMKII